MRMDETAARKKMAAASADRAPRPTQGSGGMLRFYTDESPGLKITPVVVLGMSVCFIGFVTMLHAIAKIASYLS